MEPMNLNQRYDEAMNRLAKWRTIFASWQLGTRPAFGDGELHAVKDHHEGSLLERLELDTLVALLAGKGVMSKGEVQFVEDPYAPSSETTAVKAHRQHTLEIRIDLNALLTLLIQKGVFRFEEFQLQCIEECEHKHRGLERMFPGARATDVGMHLSTPEWIETVRKYNFPP